MTKTATTQTPVTLPVSGSVYDIVRLDRGYRRVGITRNGVIVEAEHRMASAVKTIESMVQYETIMGTRDHMDDFRANAAVIWAGWGCYVSLRATSVTAEDEYAKVEGQA